MSRRNKGKNGGQPKPPQSIQIPQPAPGSFPTSYNTQVNANVSFNQHNSGFPSAAEMQALSVMVPDICERFVRMTEIEQQHDHMMQRDALAAMRSERRRSQYLGAFVVTLALCVAAYCASVGAYAAAAGIGTTTVLGLAAAFIRERSKQASTPNGKKQGK